jgi:hypothetical protein
MPKSKKPSLKKLSHLHPIEREKELRKILLENKEKKFLKIINDEIEKAESEQGHVESLDELPKKFEEKSRELDSLVKKESENLEEEKKEKLKIGKLYGHPQEEKKELQYAGSYSPYEAHHKEHLKIEIQSTANSVKIDQPINSTEENIKKTTELYMTKKKVEKHEH